MAKVNNVDVGAKAVRDWRAARISIASLASALKECDELELSLICSSTRIERDVLARVLEYGSKQAAMPLK